MSSSISSLAYSRARLEGGVVLWFLPRPLCLARASRRHPWTLCNMPSLCPAPSALPTADARCGHIHRCHSRCACSHCPCVLAQRSRASAIDSSIATVCLYEIAKSGLRQKVKPITPWVVARGGATNIPLLVGYILYAPWHVACASTSGRAMYLRTRCAARAGHRGAGPCWRTGPRRSLSQLPSWPYILHQFVEPIAR
jgi:hypothetical protein